MLTGLSICWLWLKGMSDEADVAGAAFGSDRVPLLIGGGFRAMLRRPPTACPVSQVAEGQIAKNQTCEVHKEDDSVSLRFAEVEIRVFDAS